MDAKTFLGTALAAQRLAAAMDALGVGNAELADFLGVERQTAWRWREGERGPEGHIGAWLPLLLQTTPWNLFGWPPGFRWASDQEPPLPDGTTLEDALLGRRGAILALPWPRAGEMGGVGQGRESLEREIVAMLQRAVARAVHLTLAKDDLENTDKSRQRLADELFNFAMGLQQNVGVDATDIFVVVKALREGRLT